MSPSATREPCPYSSHGHVLTLSVRLEVALELLPVDVEAAARSAGRSLRILPASPGTPAAVPELMCEEEQPDREKREQRRHDRDEDTLRRGRRMCARDACAHPHRHRRSHDRHDAQLRAQLRPGRKRRLFVVFVQIAPLALEHTSKRKGQLCLARVRRRDRNEPLTPSATTPPPSPAAGVAAPRHGQ